jgi:uncharacterized membrane protein HdeD (DUF308 family)
MNDQTDLASSMNGNVNPGVFTATGILLMVLGAAAILFERATGWFVTLLIGWILIIASVFIFGSAFGLGSVGRILFRALVGIAALVAGLWLVLNPGEGTETLTLILIFFFFFAGIFRIAAGVAERGVPGAVWLVINGILSVLIGVILWIDYPESAEWAIGLLVGIDLIFSGWVVILLGQQAKKELSGA